MRILIKKRYAGTKLRLWLVGITAVFMLSSCTTTTTQGKFSKSVTADVGVFADNTLAMLNEANFGFSKGQALYTKPFYVLDDPEEQGVINSAAKAEAVLAAMMQYSLKLVAITDAEPSQEGQVKAYAKFLGELDDRILQAFNLEKDHYEALIEKVAQQESFLNALRTAQPIINALGRFMDKALTDLDQSVDRLVKKVDKRIDTDYADLIRYQKTLLKEKYAVLKGMEELYLIGKGDEQAYPRLVSSGVVVTDLTPKQVPSRKDLGKIYEYLENRLDRLHRVGEEIKPEWELYRATHNELDRLHKQVDGENRKVRLLTLVWMRAHQKMASGIMSPAEWFDISEAPGLLLKMGSKAILPF